MDHFIHRQNLALFKKRLADPDLTEAQRKIILRLLMEECAKIHQIAQPGIARHSLAALSAKSIQ
jgi:hypothetical protein